MKISLHTYTNCNKHDFFSYGFLYFFLLCIWWAKNTLFIKNSRHEYEPIKYILITFIPASSQGNSICVRRNYAYYTITISSLQDQVSLTCNVCDTCLEYASSWGSVTILDCITEEISRLTSQLRIHYLCESDVKW